MKLAGGFRTLLTDRNKLIMTVGGATALAAGVYTTRYASPNQISYWILWDSLNQSDLTQVILDSFIIF